MFCHDADKYCFHLSQGYECQCWIVDEWTLENEENGSNQIRLPNASTLVAVRIKCLLILLLHSPFNLACSPSKKITNTVLFSNSLKAIILKRFS